MRARLFCIAALFAAALTLTCLAGGPEAAGTDLKPAQDKGLRQGADKMDRVQAAQAARKKYFGDAPAPLADTDPDFAALRDRLLYGEILSADGALSVKQKMLVLLAARTATQAVDLMGEAARAALGAGLSPVEIKEALYQCAPYCGLPKVESALREVNAVFREKGIPLPVESQATVTEESRFADGFAVQSKIFGPHIAEMHRTTPADQREIVVKHLSAYCFGDFYTRKALDLRARELVTFSVIAALGGCESQVKAHVRGNVSVGNTRAMLLDALAVLMPHMGFPRTLNALACVNEVLPPEKK